MWKEVSLVNVSKEWNALVYLQFPSREEWRWMQVRLGQAFSLLTFRYVHYNSLFSGNDNFIEILPIKMCKL